MRQVYQRVPTPGHEIYRDLGEVRPDGDWMQGGEVRGISLNWVGFITGSPLRAISACPRSLAGVQTPAELVMPCRN